MCTFLLQNDALWDLGLAHCRICAIGLSENLYCISKEEPTKICLGPFKIHMVRAQVPWLKKVYQCIWPKQLMCIEMASGYHFMAWLAEWFFTLVTYSNTMLRPRAVIQVCSTHICMVQCTHLITAGGTPHLYNRGSSMLINSLHSGEK